MKKIIKFLLNKRLLLILTSILAIIYSLAFVIAYFDGFIFYWGDYLWFAFSIALIFVVANFTPSVVLFLKEIHQNNLLDIKKQESKEVK
mgnify:CR=1 FL=1|jgi:heme exporter protein D